MPDAAAMSPAQAAVTPQAMTRRMPWLRPLHPVASSTVSSRNARAAME